MNNRINVKTNIIYNILYHLLIMILPLITAPYISRVLGAEGLGIYSYTQSTAHYFVIFTMLGLTNYGNRAIAKVRDNKQELNNTFINIYSMQVLTALLSITCYIIYFVFIRKIYVTIFYIQLFYVVSALFDINWLFFGLERFKLTVTRNLIVRVISTALIFILVKTSDDLNIYIAILSITFLVSQLVIWPFVPKFVSIVKPKIKNVISHFKPNLILFIPVIAVSLYRIMSKILLGELSDMVQTGLYENADKIINVPFGIITALGVVMLPRMSNIVAKGNIEKNKLYIRDSMTFVMCLASGMMFGLIAISPRFAPIYFGQEFIDTGLLIQIISPVILFAGWANVVRTQYLIPQGRDKTYIISVILGAILNLTANVILIGKYGAIGAAIGTIAAEISVMLFQTLATRKELDYLLYIKDNFLFFISGFIMLILLLLISKYLVESIMNLILLIILGLIIYIVVSLALFAIFNRNRFEHILLMIKRKK